ncbi:MAG: hypothetical protein EOO46_01275 [Flavobacterium sp.]|nr:MAG: hypothetical protein EOO46_01275 [Flavobacterium sp.]
MKTVLIPLLLLCACTANENTHIPFRDEVHIDDRTSFHRLRANGQAIIQNLDLLKNKAKELLIRHVVISDKRTVPVTILHLPDAAASSARNITGESHFREKEILRFKDTVYKTFAPLPIVEDTSSLSYSEIFAVFAAQITQLSQRQAESKILFLYSDLQERSVLFDSYDQRSQTLLEKNPDSVARLFLSRYPLPTSLKDIRVFLVYDPITRRDDDRYQKMLAVYKIILGNRSATIIQQSQNKFFETP